MNGMNSSDAPMDFLDPRADAHADVLIDANLRAFAERVEIPGAADAVGAGEAPAPVAMIHAAEPRAAARRPHSPRRRSRWLAAGSAMAACVAAGAVLWTTSGRSEVRAAEILASLRRAQILGVDVEFDGLTAEGVTVDGQVRVRLDHPIDLATLAGEGGPPPDPMTGGTLQARLRVTTAPDFQPWPGADVTVEGAFSERVGWVYLHADGASIDRAAAEAPQAAALVGMTRGGLVLNTGPVTDDLLRGLDLDFAPSPPGSPPGVRAGTSVKVAMPTPGTPGGVTVRGGVSVPPHVAAFSDARRVGEALRQAREAKGSDLTDDEARAVAARAHRETASAVRGAIPEAERDAFDRSVAEMEAEMARPRTAEEQTLDRLGKGLISGRATQQDLEQIKALLNGQDQRATVRNLGGGRYELTAELRDDRSTTPDAAVKVLYEQDAGVRWIELRPLRDAAGVIRLTMASDPIDPGLLDYQRLVAPGVTSYVDLRALRSLLPALMGAAGGGPGPRDDAGEPGDPDAGDPAPPPSE